MVVPQSGATMSVWWSRAGLETRPLWRTDSLTAPLTSVRRVRCSPAVYAATPMSATTAAAATTTPYPSRQRESHW